MPRVFAALTFLSILIATGCADHPPATDAAKPAVADPAAGQQSFAAPEIAWPDRAWWTRYHDPQLTRLIEQALAAAPDLAAAQARLMEANADAMVAGASLWPSLSGNASLNETKQSYHYGFPEAFIPKGYLDADAVMASLSYELDLWGKNRAAAAAALSRTEAARLDEAEIELTLAAAVADAYADLARLYRERDVAQSALAIRQATFALTSQRLRSGLDTRAELKQAEAGVPAAESAVLALDEDILRDGHRIAALLGAGPDRGLAILRPPDVTIQPFGLPPALSLDLLGRRADIAAARARAEAAAKDVDVAEAAFYPNVNLVAFIGVQSLGLPNLLASGSDVGGVGPAISLPIFTGGRITGRYRAAEAEYRLAVALYNQTVTLALRDVADVATSQRALAGQIEATRRAVADSDEAYQVARRRYQGGLANFLSVLSAEDALLANRRSLTDLEARAFSLDIALLRALGGGYGG
jgi:NodT family efflux transporter outer membrane factor (OMF) lipoprotein